MILREQVARAICMSKTCEGINCCQQPSNGGKRRDHIGQPVQCNVDAGGYDDAANAAIDVMKSFIREAITK